MTRVRSPMPGVVYMDDATIDHYVREGVLTDEPLIAAFSASFDRHADRVALSEPGVEITYRALQTITDRGAAALHRLGLRPGDRALFQMRNCKELVYAVFACLKLGVIPVCTLAAHRAQEIGYLGNHSAAKLHFVHADDFRFDMVAFARGMQAIVPSVAQVLTVRATGDMEGATSFERLIEAEDAEEAKALVAGIDHDPYQVALFQLSGGTSGVPKIIPRFSNEYRYTIQTVIDWLGFDRDIVSFTPNPLMHNAPMSCYWMPALMLGGEVAIAGGPSLAEIEHVLAERRPTWIALAKVHMLRLKENGAVDRLSFDNVFGFVVTDSAGPLREMVGAPCLPIFGMTEGLLAFVRRQDPVAAADATVGRPTSPHDELRFVTPGTETDVAEGEIGELLVRGPCTIRGYYDAPERNDEAFTQDGFYRSGDLMRVTAIGGDRYLVFEGRVKDVVDRGGEKINCAEVENALILHPAIGAAACVAMPDPLYGQRLCAFVVARDGMTAVTLGDIGAFLEAHGLAKFKWPERIEMVDTLPETTSGKVSKPMMRDIIAARLRDEAAAADPTGVSA
ncbi:AMP-binding protein [Sphingomonas profundi]|uniref:AMP-binding protein n=1 Tax=Alterirhizorhabdus profundi TaxID=2681549 RepID=UPI0018D04729|nr:AMP-binding protein [Sphingomonas profundi]